MFLLLHHSHDNNLLLQDKIYDHEKRCGFLFDMIKNRNKKNKVRLPVQNEADDEEVDELMEFLKTCVVSKDYPEIVEKMKQTVNYRKQQFCGKDQFDDILDFYLADPSLVCSYYPVTTPQFICSY